MPRISELDPNNQTTVSSNDLVPYFDQATQETGKATVTQVVTAAGVTTPVQAQLDALTQALAEALAIAVATGI